MRSSQLARFVVLGSFVGLFGASIGCTVTSKATPTPTPASQQDAGATTVTAPSAVSCTRIFECVTTCADNDAPCQDQCLATGTPAAQAQATAVADCANAAGCTAEACFKANCERQISTCVGASISGGGDPIPPGGAPTTGTVPAELVGTWQSVSLLYEFKADGAVARARRLTTGCSSNSDEVGTAVVSGASVSIYFTGGVTQVCGSPSSLPYTPGQEDFTYSIEQKNGAPQLHLRHLKCVETSQANIDFYCTDNLDKTN